MLKMEAVRFHLSEAHEYGIGKLDWMVNNTSFSAIVHKAKGSAGNSIFFNVCYVYCFMR